MPSQESPLQITGLDPAGDPEQQTAVDKALTLLMSLAEQQREIGVSELARRTQLTKSTAFRLLGILHRNKVVERVGSNYRIGTHLFDIGSRAYAATALLQECLLPYLADLYELTHETVHLAVLHDTEIVYVDKIHGHRAARSPAKVGARMPAYCTGVGKALLAFDHDAAELAISQGLFRRTEYTLTDPALFRGELRRIRQSGIAYDRQEAAPGLACVAVPIMGSLGRPVAALSVAGADHRFDPSSFAPALRRVAYDAARALAAARARASIRAHAPEGAPQAFIRP